MSTAYLQLCSSIWGVHSPTLEELAASQGEKNVYTCKMRSQGSSVHVGMIETMGDKVPCARIYLLPNNGHF